MIGVLLTLARGEGQVAMIFFSDGSLQEQVAWAEATELRPLRANAIIPDASK
jgi:hypothetical protein